MLLNNIAHIVGPEAEELAEELISQPGPCEVSLEALKRRLETHRSRKAKQVAAWIEHVMTLTSGGGDTTLPGKVPAEPKAKDGDMIQQQPPNRNGHFSLKELARKLGVMAETLTRWIAGGKVESPAANRCLTTLISWNSVVARCGKTFRQPSRIPISGLTRRILN
ncbi:MAG: hypothetical protein WD648_14510 [Planctomycetaceae bacterium]